MNIIDEQILEVILNNVEFRQDVSKFQVVLLTDKTCPFQVTIVVSMYIGWLAGKGKFEELNTILEMSDKAIMFSRIIPDTSQN
jgi:hypothetical protein